MNKEKFKKYLLRQINYFYKIENKTKEDYAVQNSLRIIYDKTEKGDFDE